MCSKPLFRASFAFAVFSVALVSTAWAAGGRTHMEMGKRAWTEYLSHEDAMLPGIGELFATEDLRRAYYCGCYFPDWGYRGINPDAAEDSHWRDFQNAYFQVLKKELTPPWDDDARMRIAFFLGSITHGVTDIPWHFTDGPTLSMLGKAKQTNDADHGPCEAATEIFIHSECAALPEMKYTNVSKYFWPYKDILAAFELRHRPVTQQQLETGCLDLTAESTLLGEFCGVVYEMQKARYPWVDAHYSDYYYGGGENGAALTAMWIRYWYAALHGWHCYQQMPEYQRKPPEYVPYLGCADTTISSGQPRFNAGAEPLLEVANDGQDERRTLIRFDIADIDKNAQVSSAKLWLYFVGRESFPTYSAGRRSLKQETSKTVAVYKVNKEWQEGRRQTDDIKGTDGTPALANEVNWLCAQQNAAPWSKPGCDAIPEDRDETAVAQAVIAPDDAPEKWIAFDVTPLAQLWVAHPEQNHGMLLKQAETAPGALRFYSSQAYKARQDGYCGGRRIAFRPILFIQ